MRLLFEVDTYTATVVVGLRAGYSSKIYSYNYAKELIQEYCAVGLGVTVTAGECIYTGGSEPCIVVGLINYPRFPSSQDTIFQHAKAIGDLLANKLEQERYTIVCPDFTRTYESSPKIQEAITSANNSG